MGKTVETKAILTISGDHGDQVDLYLPEGEWDRIVRATGTNRLQVCLRMNHEYQGAIKWQP